MGERRRYRSFVMDSARWDGFRFRSDDIVISTPPKSGTTWMQMLCALLIFQKPVLDEPLTVLSPWLDMQTAPVDEVRAVLDGQQHRRFIKTHTPLDGLPSDDRVTYIGVGRDPRDVAVSWDNHMSNLDLDVMLKLREAAVGLDDLAEVAPGADLAPPPDPDARFWRWVEDDADPTQTVGGLTGTLRHLDTFWQRRHEPNVALFHYGDLQADLPGEMRRLAAVLGVEVAEERWDELAAAATFDRMREQADLLAPEATKGLWQDNGRFFHHGSAGRWRDLVTDGEMLRYEKRVALLVEPALAAWAHDGWRAIGGSPVPIEPSRRRASAGLA